MSIKDSYAFGLQIQPYPEDERLLKKLGIATFKLPADRRSLVGTVKSGECHVDIYVEGPVQHWTFHITNSETRSTTQIKSGTGPLTAFWGRIETVAKSISNQELEFTEVHAFAQA